MKYDVIVYDKAMDDIVRNARWWAENHSQDQALIWYDAILKKLIRSKNVPSHVRWLQKMICLNT